jgi:small-conductance mechanosensitive channel
MTSALGLHLPWLEPVLRATVTIAGAYLFGRLLNLVVKGRLTRLARATEGEWDDILIAELTSRIPLWSVLVGVWISVSYWPLHERWLQTISRAISVVGFASVTFAAAAVATRLVSVYGPRATPGVPVSGLTRNIVRLLVVALGLLVVLNELGVEIRPMLAALGVGGLAVALALQEPLSNLFAGVVISMARQVRIGDQVRLDSGVEGRIVDFNWRSTWLEIGTGNVAVIPNAKLSQAIVTNFNLPTPEVAVPIDFVVGYDSDAAQVERIAADVARQVIATVDGAVRTHKPSVRFGAMNDRGLLMTAVLRAETFGKAAEVRHAFIREVHTRLREADVTLPPLPPPPPGAAPPAPQEEPGL